jgi:hypothetical protein
VWLLTLVTGAFELGLERGAETGAAGEVGVWAFECVVDELLRSLCICDARVEFRDLALGQMPPASTSLGPGGKQLADLRESEAGVLIEANESATRSALDDV